MGLKKILVGIVMLTMIFSYGKIPAIAASNAGSVDGEGNAVQYDSDYRYEILDDGTIEITGYSGEETELTVPAEIKGQKVSSIGEAAFNSCEEITSIVVSDGVKKIADDAFAFCNNLENVFLPDSVTELGEYVFSSCENLTDISLPGNLTAIGRSVFSDCISLSSIKIPESVECIGDRAFYGCYSLKTVNLSQNVSSIGNYAFYSSGLQKITIPSSVNHI